MGVTNFSCFFQSFWGATWVHWGLGESYTAKGIAFTAPEEAPLTCTGPFFFLCGNMEVWTWAS